MQVSRINSSAGVLGKWTISAWKSASSTILSATMFFTSFWPSGWYAKFRPVRSLLRTREEDEDPPHGEIGSVVSAGTSLLLRRKGLLLASRTTTRRLPPPPHSAAAAGTAAPAPPRRRRLSDYDAQHVVHGINAAICLKLFPLPNCCQHERQPTQDSPGSINIGYDVGVPTSGTMSEFRHRQNSDIVVSRHQNSDILIYRCDNDVVETTISKKHLCRRNSDVVETTMSEELLCRRNYDIIVV